VTTDHSTTEIVETEGHLIDSRLMTEIFDSVVKHGGSFEVLDFTIGRTNNDFSRLRMRVAATSPSAMQDLLESCSRLDAEPRLRATLRFNQRRATAAPPTTSTRRAIITPGCAMAASGWKFSVSGWTPRS